MTDDLILDKDTDETKVAKARANVRIALEATVDWRKEAREDYRFVQGKQWEASDKTEMQKQKRPAITINRCRPMINQIAGYFGQNASELKFNPKGKGDDEICRVAQGVTKYVYDKCRFDRNKEKVLRDRLICGVGYYWVFYDFDYDAMDGRIKIERRSPFEVFVDPESSQDDLSDAEFVGVYSWETPEELKLIYPEVEEEINGLWHKYDDEEVAVDTVGGEPIWYSKQLKKVRVVQYWYKDRSYRNVYIVNGQQQEETEELKSMYKLKVFGVKKTRVPSTIFKFMTFCDDVLFEAKDSPYKHQRFPLIPEYAYRTGEVDENDRTLEPAGIIRDLKDVQREVNKHRSQRMHIVNTQANGFWLVFGTSTPEFDAQLKNSGTTPGARFNVPPGVTDVKYITNQGVSVANVELEKSSGDDFYVISGVNPETMGSQDSPSSMSGVAIDRRQRAAFAQLSNLANESNYSEELILDILWGGPGREGLIQQYFTEEQVIRIIGDDEENQFIQVKKGLPEARQQQQMVNMQTGQPQVDEKGQAIQRVLYDLSKFEFDIKVTPSQKTPSLMQATLFQLIDAQKSGIPIPPEMMLEFMPLGNKLELKKMMQEQQQAKQPEPPKTALSINFKDLPIEAQAAILASNGIKVDPQSIADQKDIAMQAQNQPRI